MTEEQKQYELIETPPAGPDALVMMAMQRGLSAELIEKMMDLQERHERNEARRAYHDAMSRFKADPPEIDKDKTVSFGQGRTAYHHASLANVTDKINRALAAHGLSAAWKTEQVDKGITVTCTITHRLGHSESTSLTAAPDASGSKNAIQAVGSTITYLERYTILALTGLATHDQDDDGSGGAPAEFITDEQVKTLTGIITENAVDVTKFLQYMGVAEIDTIPAKDFGKAIAVLKKAKGQKPREPGQEG